MGTLGNQSFVILAPHIYVGLCFFRSIMTNTFSGNTQKYENHPDLICMNNYKIETELKWKFSMGPGPNYLLPEYNSVNNKK